MRKSDIAVVGAGIVGLAAAYEAVRLGHRVAVIDARYPGQATDAGAGIVNPLDLIGAQSEAERQRVALRGPAQYATLLGQLAEDGQHEHGYSVAGQLVVATNAEEEAVLDGLAARLPDLAAGPLGAYTGAGQRVTAAEARRMVPYLSDGAHGLLLPGVARVDGRAISAALTEALRIRGVDRYHGVGRIVTEHDRVVGVGVDGDRIDADRVILASGSWSFEDPALAELGRSIRPVRGQIVHLSYRSEMTTPIVSNIDGPYILAFPPDRIVTGATHEDVGFEHRVTAGGLHSVLDAALRLASGLAGASMVETRVGFRPVSADRLPVIGAVPGIADLVIATGLGAHGLTLGPAVGAVAARIAIGEDPVVDVSALRPERFIHPKAGEMHG